MEEFIGKKYKMVSSDNFEEYLTIIGIGYIARKAAISLYPSSGLSLNEDGSYTFTFQSKLYNSALRFRLNEEFDEDKPDGTRVKSLVILEGNKMIHTQRESSGRTSTHVREFSDNKLTVTTTVDGWDKVCMRVYHLE